MEQRYQQANVINMSEISEMMSNKDMEKQYMRMVGRMKDFGGMENLMERGIMLAVRWNIKVDGKRTSCTVMGLLFGTMEGNIKVIM